MNAEKSLLAKIFLNLSLLLIANNALAWGEDGHRITGAIAWNYLQPDVKVEVGKLLQNAGEPGLAQASTWADRIRSDDSYDWTAPLHYINLPRNWDGYVEARDCPPAGCILKALAKYEEILSDSNAVESERAEALLFIAHFVGDLHQPMHTGLREDRGGNDIEVRFFGFPTNLHALWDIYLPAGFAKDWEKYAHRQSEKITEEQRELWLDSGATEWAAESQRLAHSHAYTTESKLGEDYYQRNREIVEQRLSQGGVRLAGVINRALGRQNH